MSVSINDYTPRTLDRYLARLLTAEPAVMINGPRAAGKSTTARRHSATVVQLDSPAQALAFQNDPDAALARLERPVLLDEWQEVPGVLWAVKRAVDGGASPGSFIITGSVSARLHSPSLPTFGRQVALTLWPATQREIIGALTESPTPFLDRLFQHTAQDWPQPARTWTMIDYVRAMVRGGYPPVAFFPDRHLRWLNGLFQDIIGVEASRLSPRMSADRFRVWLQANAEQTGQQPTTRTLLDATGINRKTADRYDELLQAMFVLDLVPGWYSNRMKRLTKAPRRHLVDTGVAVAALGVGEDEILSDEHLCGHLLESFVAAQVRAEASLTDPRALMWHLRTDTQQEVDLVLTQGRRVFGIEVSSSVNPLNRADARPARKLRHLRAMRDALGDVFGAGVLLYAGSEVLDLGDRITAAPISTIWT